MRLGDVCEVVGGATPKTSNPAYWDGDIKWATPAEIRDNTYVLEDTAKRLTEAGFKSANLHMMPAGTVLLTTRAPIGKVALAGSDMCCNQGFKCLVCSDAVSNKWLYRYLKYHTPRLQAMGTGATFKELSKRAVSNLEIVLPSMDNQLAAVHKLAGVERVMAIVDQQLAKLDSLVKSRFVEMFGDPVDGAQWPRKQLGDIYDVKSSKRIYAREQTKSGVPFYRLADINALVDEGAADSGLFISEARYWELVSAGQVPIAGDILVTARGTLGRCYVVGPDDCFYFQDGMITWLSQKQASPLAIYITSVFDNVHFIDELRRNCSGTTVNYLSIADLSQTTIPLPPLSIQREFADFASCVDKLRVEAQTQKEKLQTLYDSLAQDYFAI